MKKIFQNKSLLKSIRIFLVCLVVLGGFGILKNVEAADADNNILVYYAGEYSTSEINLGTSGFIPHTKKRNGADEFTNGTINLSNYGQVWIIDAGGGAGFTGGEISAIEDFRKDCGGLLLSVENIGCQERINPITEKFNNGAGIFFQSPITTGKCWSPSFVWEGHPVKHPLYSGLSNLSSSGSDACFNIQNPTNIEITAKNPFDNSGLCLPPPDDTTCCDDTYGAVLDECGKGRIVFDSSMVRFVEYEGSCASEKSQYQQNIAKWLDVCVPCPLPACTLTAASTSIELEESSTLKWESTNADLVVSSNFGAADINGSKIVSPASATTYTLKVANADGAEADCSAMVGVMVPPLCKKGLIPCGRSCDVDSTSYHEDDDCTICHLILMMQLIMDFLFKIAAVVAALFIAAAGFMYIFATGRPEMLSLAKTTFKLTLLGFGLIFIAWILVDTILTMFGYIDPLGDGSWHIMC